MSSSSTRTEDGPLKYKLKDPPLGFGAKSTVYAAKPVPKGLKASMPVRVLRFIRQKSPWGIAWHKGFQLAVKVCELNGEKLKLTDEEKIACFIENIPVDYIEGGFAKREDLVREAEIMNLVLPNNNIVKLVDAFEYSPKEQFMLVLERMTTDLEQLTRQGVWEDFPEARISLLLQVIQALTHIKKKRIVHRDIKPSNILVSADGCAKLSDFGIAEVIPENGKLKVVSRAGTLQFMAPELFIDGEEYDYGVDVWAFGLVVYSMFTKDSSTPFKKYGTEKHFSDFNWEMWALGEVNYFSSLLGGEYLSQTERDKSAETYRKHKNYTPSEWVVQRRKKADLAKNVFYASNQEQIQTLRQIFIPYPLEGPNGDVQPREGVSRPESENLAMLPLFNGRQLVNEKEKADCVKVAIKSYLAQGKNS